MSNNNFPNTASLGHQRVDTFSQRLLFLFIGRTGIENQNLLGCMDQVTVCMSGGGSGWRSNWKTDVVGTKLDAADYFTMSCRSRQKSFYEIRSNSAGERL